MKISPVGNELFHAGGRTEADGRTEMTKLIVGSRSFANAPNNRQSAMLRSVHGTCLDGVRKIAAYLSQYRLPSGRDLNTRPLKYKADVLTT